jgi:hypothetical protein
MHVSYRSQPQRSERITHMTSQSLRKHRTTAPNSPARENSSLSRGWIRVAFLSSLPIGLAISSQSDAQQTPAWSPQPYVKPATDSIPKNSLRPDSASDTSSQVVRWRKVEGAPEQVSNSYVQTLNQAPPTQHPTTSHVSNSLVIRQPSNTTTQRIAVEKTRVEQNHGSLQLHPASGWSPKNASSSTARSEPAKLPSDNNVRFASYETTATVAPSRTTEKNESTGSSDALSWRPHSNDMPTRKRLNPAEASSRRSASNGVQRASYQEEAVANGISLPQAPSAMPQLPEANGINRLPSSPPSLDSSSILPQDSGISPPQKSLLDTLPKEPPSRPFLDSPSDQMNFENKNDDLRDIPMPSRKRASMPSTADCDTIRQSIESSDITQIRVDSSPAFVEGYGSDRRTRRKDAFLQNAAVRLWYNADGVQVAEGRLVDIVYGSVVLETANGSRTTYLLNKLSDADQVYVSESWGIPFTCSMGDGSFDARNFTATTMTWKASGACHKPLYFEEVQLERYGHEWGPLVQPAISSLNFVKNAALLPYKMGIHPMNECQYSLGYYRPGSCAPWTVGPIPISLRGAAVQAAAVSGAALALP